MLWKVEQKKERKIAAKGWFQHQAVITLFQSLVPFMLEKEEISFVN